MCDGSYERAAPEAADEPREGLQVGMRLGLEPAHDRIGGERPKLNALGACHVRRRDRVNVELRWHQATAVASISIMIDGSNSRVTPRSVLTGLHPAPAHKGTSSPALCMNASTSVV